MRRMRRLAITPLLLATLALGGCGFSVASADLFVLHRRGPGPELTALLSDGGTIRCGTAAPRALPDPLLLAARDLATDLDKDVKGDLHVAARPGSVYTYTFMLSDGSLSFADTAAAAGHPELGRAELLATQVAALCARH
jgi:ABC-type amino acid transport substrate-binding protein